MPVPHERSRQKEDDDMYRVAARCATLSRGQEPAMMMISNGRRAANAATSRWAYFQVFRLQPGEKWRH